MSEQTRKERAAQALTARAQAKWRKENERTYPHFRGATYLNMDSFGAGTQDTETVMRKLECLKQ